jgi:hypothetical protein
MSRKERDKDRRGSYRPACEVNKNRLGNFQRYERKALVHKEKFMLSGVSCTKWFGFLQIVYCLHRLSRQFREPPYQTPWKTTTGSQTQGREVKQLCAGRWSFHPHSYQLCLMSKVSDSDKTATYQEGLRICPANGSTKGRCQIALFPLRVILRLWCSCFRASTLPQLLL